MMFSLVFYPLIYKTLDIITRWDERLCKFMCKFLLSDIHGTSVIKLEKSQTNHS